MRAHAVRMKGDECIASSKGSKNSRVVYMRLLLAARFELDSEFPNVVAPSLHKIFVVDSAAFDEAAKKRPEVLLVLGASTPILLIAPVVEAGVMRSVRLAD